MSQLPPLNALRAFETTARLGSFTRAAQELGVTPAAVGQQVRSLEARLGRTLFLRSGDGLTLMPFAGNALADIQRGFDNLSQGYRSLSPNAEKQIISISVPPTFAIKWLVPRLHSFYERYPATELKFDTAMRFVDVGRGEVDLAIRFGSGRYPGLRKERLLEEWVVPLCAPILCRGKGGLKYPNDLDRFSLLHINGETADSNWLTWPKWAGSHNLEGQHFGQGPIFTQSLTALQAACEGQGIALCGISYALEDILAGRLYAPFGTECAVRTEYAYDMVYTPVRAEHPPVLAFRRWLKSEASKSRKRIGEYLAMRA
jgi:LysR family glycine cleavage system transcriptional activator